MKKLCLFLVVVLLVSIVPASTTTAADYTHQAETLKELGLFLGTDTGFELERAATRAEAAVMTVRILGKEDEAKQNNHAHPFSDVPDWASPHIGYLYYYRITMGVSDTQFGSFEIATASQYATFILRALGYDDSAGDFVWNTSLEKMVSLGIITEAQSASFSSGSGVLRGDVVAISYFSLFAYIKETTVTLIEKLFLFDEAITPNQLMSACYLDNRMSMFSNTFGFGKSIPPGGPLTSEEVFAKASSAVFKINIFAMTGVEDGSGSGFFITSDGIAVTNMHVIYNMSSATITTPDKSTYPVEGVLAMYPEADLAIIKIQGSDFPYLEVGDPSTLRVAQRIYCVGSPLGFDNTISDGLVSSLNREYDGYDAFIQISAPIAPGSSGGALLNEYGQVVGVTTLGSVEAQINLAVPISELAHTFRFTAMRSPRYLQAHNHFGCIPIGKIYTEIESAENKPTQTMENDTLMFGTITDSSDVDYFALDVKERAEIFVSLTSDVQHSAGLRFEVSDPSGKVILKSRHFNGEIFSFTTGHGATAGLYTIRIYVEGNSQDWSNVNYELFWIYHQTIEDSGRFGILYEFEPNNTPEYANYIPNFFGYDATITDSSDVDYYSFTLTQRKTFSALIITNHSKSVLSAEVFDSSNRSVGRFIFTDEVEIYQATLPAGDYYIKVSPKDQGMNWDNEGYLLLTNLNAENN